MHRSLLPGLIAFSFGITSPGPTAVWADENGAATAEESISAPAHPDSYRGSAAYLGWINGAVPGKHAAWNRGAHLQGTFTLSPWMMFEGTLTAFQWGALEGVNPGNTGASLALGVRMATSAESKGLRPYGALRVAHIHEAPTPGWGDHPLSNLMGSTEYGLKHRTGLGLALGFDTPIAAANDTGLRLGAELETLWVPYPYMPSLYTNLTLSVGVPI